MIGAATCFACGGKATKQANPRAPTAAPAPAPKPAPIVRTLEATPNVAVSDEVAKQCNLRFANVEGAPKFSYNEAELVGADRDILQQVADCLVRGPLQGRSVQLIGRADPRGTDEYNLGLGTRRAETVRSYLQRLGVSGSRMTPVTRGELDASGADEGGWERDRRVDLQLVN